MVEEPRQSEMIRPNCATPVEARVNFPHVTHLILSRHLQYLREAMVAEAGCFCPACILFVRATLVAALRNPIRIEPRRSI